MSETEYRRLELRLFDAEQQLRASLHHQLLRIEAQAASDPAVFSRIEAAREESRLRDALILPLGAISVLCAVTYSPWGWLGLIVCALLARWADERWNYADGLFADSIELGIIESAAVKDFHARAGELFAAGPSGVDARS